MTTIIGSLYVYAYESSVFQVTPRTYVSNPDFSVSDCSAAAYNLPYPENAGGIGFGDSIVADVCSESDPLPRDAEQSYWSRQENGDYLLDETVLDSLLADAPMEGSFEAAHKTVEVLLPDPAGSYIPLRITNSPIYTATISWKHPEVRSYLLQGADPPRSGRLTRTSLGVHAIVLGASGNFVLGPQSGKVRHYSSQAMANKSIRCGLDLGATPPAESIDALPPPTGNTLHSYRLAINATEEYTNYFGGASVAEAQMISTVGELNALYERDLTIRFVIVYLQAHESPDPYTPPDINVLSDQNQLVTDGEIGSSAYDIGHLFHRVSSQASNIGFGALGGVCAVASKAKAISATVDPASSLFSLGYLAHEVGHQFNAIHTMNDLEGTCPCVGSPERTGVEPATGSTIMSYAGLCPVESGCNVEPTNDDYFHAKSIESILLFRNSSTCASQTVTSNSYPIFSSNLPDYTIPRETPFSLSASSMGWIDPNADRLVFCWEQTDRAGPGAGIWPAAGPLFRSRAPSENKDRSFPMFEALLAGPPTSILEVFELLPSVDRDMNFRITVRDMHAGAGGLNYDDVKVRAEGQPFRVTYPNGSEILNSGSSITVTWAPGAGGIQDPMVDIMLLSQAAPVVLAANVPNDGAHNVVVPTIVTTQARIKLKASTNIFLTFPMTILRLLFRQAR